MPVFKLINNFHALATVRQIKNKGFPFTVVLILAEMSLDSSSTDVQLLAVTLSCDKNGCGSGPHSFPGSSHWFLSWVRTSFPFVLFPPLASESGSDTFILQVLWLTRCSGHLRRPFSICLWCPAEDCQDLASWLGLLLLWLQHFDSVGRTFF